ncbi:PD-(D/E)XK nuclease family protein [Parasphingorhabdus pacifica]
MTYLDRPSPPRSGAWAHSTLGAVVHNVLRAFFELPPEERTPDRMPRLLRRYWKSDGFAGADQVAEYRARAERWLTDYVERNDVSETPLAVERWVSAPAGTIIAEGRADRIDERGGELVVVDYKTGRHGVNPDDARDSMALGLYALAARKTFRAKCDRVELHHLPSGGVVSWEHTEESIGAHLRRAEQLAEEIRTATEAWEAGDGSARTFPARTGRHCAWCDFRAHCPEGRETAAGAPSWALLGD